MTSTTLANVRPKSRTIVPFAVLGVLQATLIAAMTVLSVAVPSVKVDLDLGDTGELGLVNASYGIAFGGFLLLGGRLSDFYGRKRMLLTGLVMFTLASAASALAGSAGVLIALRFVQGGGAALITPAAMAMVGVLYPDIRERARMLAIWGGLNGIGATFGNVVAGAVVTWASWRWIFVGLAVIGLAAMVLVSRLAPSGSPPRRAPLDIPGAVLVTVGIIGLVYGLLMSSPVAALVGTAVLGGFVWLESKRSDPLVPLRFLANRRRAFGILAIFFTAASMATSYFLLSLDFQQVRGWSPLVAGLAFALPGLALLATGRYVGALISRIGARVTAVVGLFLAGLGLLGIAWFLPYGWLMLVVFAIGAGLAFSGAMVEAIGDAKDSEAGLAGGLAYTAMEVGPTAIFAIYVTLSGAGAAVPYVVAGAVLILLALLSTMFFERGLLPKGKQS